MDAMRKASDDILKEQAAGNESFRKVHEHWSKFLADQVLWSSVNDGAAEQFMISGAPRT